MRVVAIEEHHIVPEMSSYMDLSPLPPALQTRRVGERSPGAASLSAPGWEVAS